MTVLNLYSGIGGNRALWTDVNVTGVEINEDVAKLYKKLYPTDNVVCGDAMAYLKKNHHKYNMVFASPPCQSHSRFNLSKREKPPIDKTLGELIRFLSENFKGVWVVENVRPYHKENIMPTFNIGRHCFWSNIDILLIPEFSIPKVPNIYKLTNLKGKEALHKQLGIYFDEIIYMGGNHCPAQILRNAVHPFIGKFILDEIKKKNEY